MSHLLRQRGTAITELCDEIVRFYGSKLFTGAWSSQTLPLGVTERELIFEHGVIRTDAAAGGSLSVAVQFTPPDSAVAYDADYVVSEYVLRDAAKSSFTLSTATAKAKYDLWQRNDGSGYGPIIPVGSVISIVFPTSPNGLLSNFLHWNLRFRTRKN